MTEAKESKQQLAVISCTSDLTSYRYCVSEILTVEFGLTGTLSGYFFRIFSPSALRFSNVFSSLYSQRIVSSYLRNFVAVFVTKTLICLRLTCNFMNYRHNPHTMMNANPCCADWICITVVSSSRSRDAIFQRHVFTFIREARCPKNSANRERQ